MPISLWFVMDIFSKMLQLMVWRQILVPKNWIWSFIPCQIDQEKKIYWSYLVMIVFCVCVPVCSVVFLCAPRRKRESIHHVFDGFRQQLDLVSFSFRSKSHRRKNLNVQSPGDVSQEVDKNSLCPSLFFKGGFYKWGYPKMVGIYNGKPY